MPDAAIIEAWIAARIAARLNAPRDGVNCDVRLERLGLSQHELVALSGELQDWLGVPVCPVIAWEFASIAAIARHLASQTR
jgi:hypothetical protein